MSSAREQDENEELGRILRRMIADESSMVSLPVGGPPARTYLAVDAYVELEEGELGLVLRLIQSR